MYNIYCTVALNIAQKSIRWYEMKDLEISIDVGASDCRKIKILSALFNSIFLRPIEVTFYRWRNERKHSSYAGFVGTQRSIETLDNLIRIVYVLDIYYWSCYMYNWFPLLLLTPSRSDFGEAFGCLRLRCQIWINQVDLLIVFIQEGAWDFSYYWWNREIWLRYVYKWCILFCSSNKIFFWRFYIPF